MGGMMEDRLNDDMKLINESTGSLVDYDLELPPFHDSTVGDIRQVLQRMDSALTNDRIESIISPMKELLETISAIVAQSMKVVLSPVLDEVASGIQNALSRIRESLKGYKLASITEERKEQLLQANEQWGTYGWSINPMASISTMFDNAPSSKKEADILALKECSDKNMREVFQLTMEMKRLNKIDYQEAVYDFENKKYKSCALILFSLIDSKMIRLQRKTTLQGGRRKVGFQAIDKVKDRVDEKTEKDMIFAILFQQNVLFCLKTMFMNGNDFQTQPEVINRNFLDHGMQTSRVRRKDCVQLFLLYFNVLELLEMIYR